MNATMETILHRRSIRSFLEKPIPKPVLEEIVLAGQYAPSAMNRQNWHFTVLQNQEKIQSLPKAIAAELGMGEEYCFYRPAIRAKLDELGVPADHLVGGMAALGYFETAPEAKPRAEGTVTWVE